MRTTMTLVRTAEEVEGSATLRQQVRMRAERMFSGQRPMMCMHGGTGESGTSVGEDE